MCAAVLALAVAPLVSSGKRDLCPCQCVGALAGVDSLNLTSNTKPRARYEILTVLHYTTVQ